MRRRSANGLCRSLRGYRRGWITGDLIAAVTLLAVAVPEQIATARLAGMGPITGLYAFVAGSLMIALLGAHHRMSVGADSTIAPLVATGIAGLAAGSANRYVALAGILAVEVGLLVALIGLLRLGWLAEFLSVPIITGFLAGVAIIIVVHQLEDLLGLAGATGSTLARLHTVAAHLGQTNGWSLAIGLGVLALVLATDWIDRRLPGALVALIGSLALVSLAHLRRDDVAVLGTLAHGAPRVGLHDLSLADVTRLGPVAAVVALVVVTQTAATARGFPDPHPDRADLDRDMVGLAAGNALAGLLGAFPVDASPPRTGVVVASGGRTQVVSIGAAAGAALLVPVAGVLTDVPRAALAGILLFVASRIFRGRELAAIARFDLVEFALAVATLLTVALIGVEVGILVAVGLAILDRARLTARPALHILGRIPGTTSWTPAEAGRDRSMPGLLVLSFSMPMWYANADRFRSELDAVLDGRHEPVHAIVLDVVGMTDLDYTASQVL
ncbi:MAG TPA: SulP family inorganic anion transporter, partial [Solirubrobacteraceae bacterium]|nr:SulP family inorganic anion transporter [Solirubrobacteraceae bacterium]